jgi:SAM-dependent methyltransferase
MSNDHLSPRARLYDRLPVTDDVSWWCDLAAASPDGRVLELGAGTGRLTRHLADHAEVVAVDHDATAIARLRDRVDGAAHAVQGVVADVVALDLGDRFGLVALPVSLLNEIPTLDARRATVARAAAHCRPDGRVAFALLNPVWLLAGGRSTGTIDGSDGERVRLEARHRTVDLWEQRARARLSYRFPDGERIVDEVDAAAVFPAELALLLDAVGMVVEEAWGATPGGDPPAADDGAWHVVARFRAPQPDPVS